MSISGHNDNGPPPIRTSLKSFTSKGLPINPRKSRKQGAIYFPSLSGGKLALKKVRTTFKKC